MIQETIQAAQAIGAKLALKTALTREFKVKFEVRLRISKPGEPNTMYRSELTACTADGLLTRINNVKETLNPDFEIVIKDYDYSMNVTMHTEDLNAIAKAEIAIYDHS